MDAGCKIGAQHFFCLFPVNGRIERHIVRIFLQDHLLGQDRFAKLKGLLCSRIGSVYIKLRRNELHGFGVLFHIVDTDIPCVTIRVIIKLELIRRFFQRLFLCFFIKNRNDLAVFAELHDQLFIFQNAVLCSYVLICSCQSEQLCSAHRRKLCLIPRIVLLHILGSCKV